MCWGRSLFVGQNKNERVTERLRMRMESMRKKSNWVAESTQSEIRGMCKKTLLRFPKQKMGRMRIWLEPKGKLLETAAAWIGLSHTRTGWSSPALSLVLLFILPQTWHQSRLMSEYSYFMPTVPMKQERSWMRNFFSCRLPSSAGWVSYPLPLEWDLYQLWWIIIKILIGIFSWLPT